MELLETKKVPVLNQKQNDSTQGLSLYLHIPFCKTRCSYCDFNTYTNLGHLFGRYTGALCSEIERTLTAVAGGVYNPLAPLPLTSEPEISSQPVYSIFLGGGTPSLLPPVLLEKLMKAITRHSSITSQTEITAEANPGTLSLEKLRALRDMGLNRLSFGVQTFDDNLLRSLGRTHNAAGAVEAYEQARRAGFDNLNLDFIYGLPEQTLAAWRATLERAISLRPEHLSLYALTIEENTNMGRALARGQLQPPDDDLMADMYLLALELLDKAGYIQYEISNWALPEKSQNSALSTRDLKACRHNLVYWRNQPYLGFGPGAHSSFGGYRYAVLSSPQEYIARLNRGESVIEIAEAEEITPELKLADTVILALRLNEGLELARIEREFGQPLDRFFPGIVENLLEWGLVEEFRGEAQEPRLRLTLRGRLLSNEVFIRFLPE
jgi:oxygen-independent coproporphyrinogen-3 oxidase